MFKRSQWKKAPKVVPTDGRNSPNTTTEQPGGQKAGAAESSDSLKKTQELMTAVVQILSSGNRLKDFELTGHLVTILRSYASATRGNTIEQGKVTAQLTDGIDNEHQKAMWTSLFSTCDKGGPAEAQRQFVNERLLK